MLFQVVSNITDKVDLFIEDDMTVGEVRVLIGQMIDADEEIIRLTFQGHVLEDNTATWGLILEMYPLVEGAPRKLFVHVSEKLRTGPASMEAMRDALLTASGQEDERNARMQARMMEPMIDLMVKDPSMLDMMIASNPGLKKMLEKHPEVKSHISDPETLKTMMMSQIDPDQRRSLNRGMGLQLAQLSAIPGGEQLFEHLTSEYLNDMAAMTENNTSSSSYENVDETQARPDPNKEANTEALPNPWEQRQQKQASNLEGMAGWGPMDESMNPFLSALTERGGRALGGSFPFTGLPGNASASDNNPFATLPFLPPWMMQPSNLGNNVQQGTGPSNAQVAQDATAQWAPQLAVLKDMGFENEALCLEALRACNGDIDAAVSYIADKDK